MKRIKLPRKRKKVYCKEHGNSGYGLAVMANEVCLEMDEQGRGFEFHSKFIKRFGKGVNRFKVLENY